jgi:DNA modification methylase
MRNEIVWNKGDAGAGGISHQGADGFRMYPNGSERCLFFMLGEQGFNNNADNYWDGWENVRLYLKEQKELMGWTSHQMKEIAGGAPNGHGDHWTGKSQWMMPTQETYESWQRAAQDDAFRRDYDDLRRDYDDLRRDFYATRAHFDNTHENMTDVWDYPRVAGEDRHGHATPKPVEMMQRIIKSSSPKGAVVYDPFLGSGTTMVACEMSARLCFGIEIDPPYVAVTLQRLSDMGLQPRLTNG